MLFYKTILHIVELWEQLWPFPTFCILHIWKPSLLYEHNNSFLVIVQDRNPFLDLWFKLQVFLILILSYSFNERDKNVTWVTDVPPVRTIFFKRTLSTCWWFLEKEYDSCYHVTVIY